MTTPVMTKTTILEWEGDLSDPERYNQIIQKAHELAAIGLTDGNKIAADDYSMVRRNWVDETAAQDWINFVVELNSRYNVTLKSSQIVDI